MGQTNDGQYATFELSIIYKIKKEDVGKFYKIANSDDIPQKAYKQREFTALCRGRRLAGHLPLRRMRPRHTDKVRVLLRPQRDKLHHVDPQELPRASGHSRAFCHEEPRAVQEIHQIG